MLLLWYCPSLVLSGAVADVVTGSLAGPGAWSQSVGAAFLEPYNLNSDKSTITANGTKGPIHAALKQLDGVEVYSYQAEHDEYTRSHIPRCLQDDMPNVAGADPAEADLNC